MDAHLVATGAGHVFLATDVDGDNRADLLTQLENAGANRIDLYWVEAADPGASAWTTPILIGNVPRSDHSLGFQGWKLAQIESGGSPEVVISSYQGVYYFRIPVNPSDRFMAARVGGSQRLRRGHRRGRHR
jgi:hypothetical protein